MQNIADDGAKQFPILLFENKRDRAPRARVLARNGLIRFPFIPARTSSFSSAGPDKWKPPKVTTLHMYIKPFYLLAIELGF